MRLINLVIVEINLIMLRLASERKKLPPKFESTAEEIQIVARLPSIVPS